MSVVSGRDVCNGEGTEKEKKWFRSRGAKRRDETNGGKGEREREREMYSARSASEMEGSKEKAGNGGWRRGRRIERKRVKERRGTETGDEEKEKGTEIEARGGERRMDEELRKRSIGKRKSREERKMEKMAGKGEKVSRSAEEASSRSWSYL